MNEEIYDEWKRHESRYTRKWRVAMAARKKPLKLVQDANVSIHLDEFSQVNRAAIEKDIHIIRAALGADKVIVTRDDALRLALSSTTHGKKICDKIIWCNPVSDGCALLED